MISRFAQSFKETGIPKSNGTYKGKLKLEDSLVNIVSLIGGKTFNNGIYRVCDFDSIDRYTSLVEVFFPNLKSKIQVFAFDWLGRFFALDQTTGKRTKSEIILIEPGAGDALEIPANIIDFHNSILVDHQDEALAKPFFKEWYSSTKVILKFTDCAGYQIPLFLEGEDEITNLEIMDIDVYFSLCSQLWNKTRQMKPGQTIRDITIT